MCWCALCRCHGRKTPIVEEGDVDVGEQVPLVEDSPMIKESGDWVGANTRAKNPHD